jgi:hypothetical protein
MSLTIREGISHTNSLFIFAYVIPGPPSHDQPRNLSVRSISAIKTVAKCQLYAVIVRVPPSSHSKDAKSRSKADHIFIPPPPMPLSIREAKFRSVPICLLGGYGCSSDKMLVQRPVGSTLLLPHQLAGGARRRLNYRSGL